MAVPVEKLTATSLVRLSRYLDKRFNEEHTETSPKAPGQWIDFELETIVDDLSEDGVEIPELLTEKIEVLKTLWVNPYFFYENILGFIAVCDVISETPHDFTTLILPNSLEVVGAIIEVKDVLDDWKVPTIPFSESMQKGITKILIEDGFSESPIPEISSEYFPKDTPKDKSAMEAKTKAIQIYVKHLMEK